MQETLRLSSPLEGMSASLTSEISPVLQLSSCVTEEFSKESFLGQELTLASPVSLESVE